MFAHQNKITQMMVERKKRFAKKKQRLTASQQMEIINDLFRELAKSLLNGTELTLPFGVGKLYMGTIHNYSCRKNGALEGRYRNRSKREGKVRNRMVKDIYFVKWERGSRKQTWHYIYFSSWTMRYMISDRLNGGGRIFAYEVPDCRI